MQKLKKPFDGPKIFMIEINAVSPVSDCQDNGGWSHCSESAIKLADWAASLLHYTDTFEKEWGPRSNLFLTKVKMSAFHQIKKNDLIQFVTHKEWNSAEIFAVNGLISRKENKAVKSCLRILAKKVEKDCQDLFDYLNAGAV